MPENTTIAITAINVDLTRIENAEVRRAVRQLTQQVQEIISQQQIEIEALLQLMLDKNVSSISEFRRHVQRMAQRASERNDRVHSQIAQTMRDNGLQATPREVAPEEPESRQVYRL